MLTSRKATAPAKERQSPIELATAASLGARTQTLAEHLKSTVAKIIALEKPGTLAAHLDDKHDKHIAALALLNGDDGPLLAIDAIASIDVRLAHLYQARGDLEEALRLGEYRLTVLLCKEAGERFAARKGEYVKVMRGVALAVLELEHALQARDRFIAEIKPAVPLSGQGWPMMGRIKDPACQAYRFLMLSVAEGWLSDREAKQELENARSR